MAVSNVAVFECRPATGNDLNSGGFVTTAGGTDYSQQAGSHVTFDGVTIAAHTAVATATIILTGYTVATTDAGNLVRIAGGTNFTAGLYQIVSVNVGANTWTLDRNATTGAGVGMTGRMGGALATLVQFFADADANTNVTGGYVCYITGTYTITTAVLVNGNYNANVAGGNTSTTLGGIKVIGYNASRTDNGQFTFTTATNSVDLLHFSSNTRNVTFYNCAFTTSAGTVAYGATTSTVSATPQMIAFDNCTFTGFKRAIYSDGPNNAGQFTGLYLRNCVVTGCTTDGIVNNCATTLANCYVYSNTGDGVRLEASFGSARGPLLCLRSIFYSNTGYGAMNLCSGNTPNDNDATTTFINCNFVSNTLDGARVNISGNNGLVRVYVENCIFYGNSQFGLNMVVLYGVLLGGYNAYGSNTSGAYGNAAAAMAGDVTLSGDPFNGRTSNDFSLNSTAGAGAACKAAGFPGVLQLGGTGGEDIGPLQSSAGGGSTTIVIGRNVTNYLGEQGDF